MLLLGPRKFLILVKLYILEVRACYSYLYSIFDNSRKWRKLELYQYIPQLFPPFS